MKRIFSLILALTLLLTMAACGGNNTNTTNPTEGKIKTDVVDGLTWDRINAIPIANDSMTEEQLRQICLDFFRIQLTFAWTPSHEVTYSNGSSQKTFYPGTVYGGIPYISSHFGNIYTAVEYCDPDNGVLDLSKGASTFQLFGNQCSSSAFWAWARVCNSLTYGGSSDATIYYGALPVGNYTYPETLRDFRNHSTALVCEANGKQTMFEAYAQLKPADGLATYAAAGHVRMVAAKPEVVRNADGTIDGAKSTLVFMDQVATWSKETQSNGSSYEIEGGLNIKTSFNALFNNDYLPFTMAELNKTKPVDKGEVSFSHKDSSVSVLKLANCSVKSNYAISNVSISIKDASGKEVYVKSAPAYREKLVNFSSYLRAVANANELKPYADGNHTVEVSARIGTGEKLVAYTGTLTS